MTESLQALTAYVNQNDRLKDVLEVSAGGQMRLECLAQGEHNVNYTLRTFDGRVFVLRVNAVSQMNLDNQIRYEYDALRLLEPSGCTPRALFVDDSPNAPGCGLLVMSFHEGNWMDYHRESDIMAAAHMMAQVHSVMPPASNHLVKPKDPLAAQLAECEGHFAGYRGSAFEDPHAVAAIERLFEKAYETAKQAGQPKDVGHILNTEAVQSHFLIDDKAPHGGCMVDWEKPIMGEVAQDVAYFLAPTTTIWDDTFMFDAHQRKRFIDDYWRAVDGTFDRADFDARFAAFLQSNCLRGITWSCNAWVEYHDPNRPLKNEKTFKKLQTYFSPEFLAHVERDCFDNVG